MNKPLTLCILSCALLGTTFIWFARADEVDDLVKNQIASQHIPGAAVVVVKDGKIVKAEGYGLADVEQKTTVTSDTVFRIQSISKQFTAAGVMMLVEEGKIGLDDPVSRYLDGTPPSWKTIAIRHLLTHTSGIKDFINEPTADLGIDVTEEQVLQAAAPRPLNFQPGEAWAYSNTNYHLLAMVIRKVSGQWYGDFLAERIFKPLGMTRTAVVRDIESIPGRATGYAMENGRLQKSGSIAPSISSYGGGGIWSTVNDMAKWDAALYTEQLLKRATLEQMWTPVKLNNGSTHEYGFGWEIGQIAGHRRIWHGGNWIGFSAEIDRYLDDHLTVIVLTNLAGASPGRIARAVAGTYLPDVAAPVYKPIPDNEPQVTARLVDLLRRCADGVLKPDEFTPVMWEALVPRLDQMRKDFMAIGPIQKLTLVERTAQADDRSYRYRAQFKNTGFILHFVITKDDKVALMLPEEVNQ